MNDREIIIKCLERGWEDDFDIVGEDVVEKIVDDILQGRGYQFESASGGQSFDISSHLQDIFSIASILIGILQLYYQIKAEHKDQEANKDLTEEVIEQAERRYKSEKYSVRFVAKLLIEVELQSKDKGE